MNSLLQITFPKNEHGDVKARLNDNKIVYTIRVDSEYGKYKEGDVLTTEWGSTVKILSVKKINGGIEELRKEYRHFDQLTDGMINELRPFQDMEIISLKIK